ncbi:hypothetical protein RB619_04670 [Flavobacterium sp. LHD-80]|uniref:hypothetical protein n=1 Tax=Flavobacterium sp. LHD-80 TaxID=3071411 RepID=UPI0027DEBDAF|nr:hypothetical protein [Flavobacterium sp. LHD-80]MDQ6469929.1 hypothetical protein [Flavobacterium sp. LHD-80]
MISKIFILKEREKWKQKTEKNSQFEGISFLYGSKKSYKISLLKVTFIAFIRGVFSKKTTQTLDLVEKTLQMRLFCVLVVF